MSIAANDTILKVSHLSKVYRFSDKQYGDSIRDIFRKKTDRHDELKTVTALNDISFELKSGESLGIIGQNGAGKSTLLKILSGITKPTGGEVAIRGRVLSVLDVGMGFHPDLSGRENIYLSGEILGMSRSEIDKKYKAIVDFSGIGDFVYKPVKFYSSGMFLRLAFSTVVNMDADLLLFDEVLAVGDAAFRQKCTDKIYEMKRNQRSFVLVSHNMGDIERVCDKAMELEHGSIKSYGNIMEVIGKYITGEGQPGETDIQEKEQEATANEEEARGFTARHPDTGAPLFRVLDAFCTDSNNRVKNNFTRGEAIYINLQYELFDATIAVDIAYALRDILGTLLLGDGTPRIEQKVTGAGKYQFSALLPKEVINTGQFMVDFEVLFNNQREKTLRGYLNFYVEGETIVLGGKSKHVPLLYTVKPRVERLN